MYHEEQIVNGVLCWRDEPGDVWIPFTVQALTTRAQLLQAERDALKAEVVQLQQKLEHYDKEVEDLYTEQTAKERQQLASYKAALAEIAEEVRVRWSIYHKGIQLDTANETIRKIDTIVIQALTADRRRAAEGGVNE